MALVEPVSGSFDLRATRRWEDSVDPGLTAAFQWASENTPEDAVLLSPPWAADAFSSSRRAQVSAKLFVQYWRFDEWRDRLNAVVGPLESPDDLKPLERFRERFAGMTMERILAIMGRYGATHLVTETRYDLPLLYRTGTWQVYSLSPPESVREPPG